jgi:arsenate reductase
MRMLVLCTHNSARSQIAEGFLRHYARSCGLQLEVWSAGTQATQVKPEAVEVMREAGIDISEHTSKLLSDVPDPWNFDLVLTVCDSAQEACPAYPAKTIRLHRSFPDPSGQPLGSWREVSASIDDMARNLVAGISQGSLPSDDLPSTGRA